MIKVSRAELSGIIDAIPSKSYAHRALILAALCNSSTTLFGKSTGVDTDATVGVLSALGANIQSTDFGYVVEPIKNLNNNISLNVKESGSTLRFILPLTSVSSSASFHAQMPVCSLHSDRIPSPSLC